MNTKQNDDSGAVDNGLKTYPANADRYNPNNGGYFNAVPKTYVGDVTPERRQQALDRSEQVAENGRRKLWQRADE